VWCGMVELGAGVVEAGVVEVKVAGSVPMGGSTPPSSRHVMSLSALSKSHWPEVLHQ